MAAGGFSRTWTWRAEAASLADSCGERVCAVFCLTRRASSEAGEAGDEHGKVIFMEIITRSQDERGREVSLCGAAVVCTTQHNAYQFEVTARTLKFSDIAMSSQCVGRAAPQHPASYTTLR
jgi:hypothetical protein